MNEINYGAVFGVETGANEPAPAQQAPAEDNTAETVETKPENTETDAGEKETAPAEQSAAENAKQAAARRKRERDAEIAKIRADAQAEAQRSLDEAIKALGKVNPFTGKPITNKAEYDAWQQQDTAGKRTEVAEAAGMSETEFDSFVDRLPAVQNYKRAAEAASRQEQKMVLEDQISQVAKLDPTVKSVQDLMQRPEYPQIYEKVKRGISIVDAFKLVNFDKLTAAAGSAAKQAALNAANSKEHLAPTSQRGSGAIPVPADVKATYRLLNPDATDAEIQEHYNRFHKS